MKKFVSFFLAVALSLSLSGCVSTDTPKSGELSAQYDYYSDSMNDIRSSMKITPEQADDVFIALTASGLDGKVTKISDQKDGGATYFQVWQGGTSYDVYLSDGTVSKITQGKDTLYPEVVMHNVLMDYELTIEDVKNGTGDSVIGQRAYIRITTDQLSQITADNFIEFANQRVKDSGYNWVSIVCEDGTGICFPGSMVQVADYGNLDDDGSILESLGTIALESDGSYSYTQK